jgi:hypothetical protein
MRARALRMTPGRALSCLSLSCLAFCGALTAACGYHFTARAPSSPLAVEITSAASEPGLPLMLRRALDVHAPRLGLKLTSAPSPDGDDHTLSVLLAHPQTHTLVVGRAGEGSVAATAYEVTLRADVRCGAHHADLSAAAQYRDLTAALSTDDARRDALTRAASDLGDQVAAWALVTCAQ